MGAVILTEANREAEDRVLVRRAQSGDRGAFDQLMRKYQQRILQLMKRYTHDSTDAEDALQEAFLKAYRGVEHFRRECSFYTWLYRISINSAKNMMAARMRKNALFVSEATGEPDGVRVASSKDAATPENALLTEEIYRFVTSAMNSLPEEQRMAVLLRELEGRSYEAIAAIMHCPVGTVRSRIYRARELIDRRLRMVFEDGIGRDHRSGHQTALRGSLAG